MSDNQKHSKLNQLFATAICGNDILSSALYVSGIAIIYSGIYAPIVLLLVVIVLFLYKSVYIEVVEALPINGGAYNCLLNGTSKVFASVAGIMTTLSYIATAVISAKIGIEYFLRVFQPGIATFASNATFLPEILRSFLTELPVIPLTIFLLGLFALLVISGVKDSAKVAFGIFAFHVGILTTFLILGLVYTFSGHSFLAQNIENTKTIIFDSNGLINMFFLAFSASLLGVSGFESSANFVEEQRKGVFRKTLRNMLLGVAIFNPLIALIVANSMPISSVIAAKDFLLADAAHVLGGSVFQAFMGIDALLVLSGAVLTAYVGVSGLMYRMSADGCLPNVLNKINKKGSYPRIIITFFLLCSSILIVTNGELLSLAGVYTISFLGVMSLFALGNLTLRQTRTELKRTYNAPILFVIFAFLATAAGIVGNVRIDPQNLNFFGVYFIPAFIFVLAIVFQDRLVEVLLRFSKKIPFLYNIFSKHFEFTTRGKFVAFVHHVDRLQAILEYINLNETGRNITLICCKNGDGENNYKNIIEILPKLRNAGFYRHLNIEVKFLDREFSPETIDFVSHEFDTPKNRIMIGSIHHHHPFDYAELGGVRIIF